MTKKLYGLLGWPVSHSISPAMMDAAFTYLNMNATYLPFAVKDEDVGKAVAGLMALGAVGVNVTIPHKQAAMRLATHLTEEASQVGAVNTLRFDAETQSIFGHNTDVTGWWDSVESQMSPSIRKITVIGAGGAARAVIAALNRFASGATIVICARNVSAAKEMADEFTHVQPAVVDFSQCETEISESNWVINTTPIGMWPKTDSSPVTDASCFKEGQFVQDLIYRPVQTRFLEQAQQRGCTVQNGLEMLVQQGARSFGYWTGIEAPIDVMRRAALNALRQ